jgi:fumarylacetoacetase
MTWVPGAAGSGFDIDHLPYGVVVPDDGRARCAVRIGGYALDLRRAESAELLLAAGCFQGANLDAFLALGPAHWSAVRAGIKELLTDTRHRHSVEPLLMPLDEVSHRLPWTVADYVDFYSSEHHASNVGAIFRPGQPALTPNWKHLPIGYHGRAGTVVVSGTPIVRPSGQRGEGDFGPSRRLDIEAEVGFVVGTGSRMGNPWGGNTFPSTCSASSSSTTGRRVTFSRGSTSRSGPSWASRSPRPCRRGSHRLPRSIKRGRRRRPRIRPCCPIWPMTAAGSTFA